MSSSLCKYTQHSHTHTHTQTHSLSLSLSPENVIHIFTSLDTKAFGHFRLAFSLFGGGNVRGERCSDMGESVYIYVYVCVADYNTCTDRRNRSLSMLFRLT